MEHGPFTDNYLPGNKKMPVRFFVGSLGFYKNLMRWYYLRVIELLTRRPIVIVSQIRKRSQ
jgi:hypothetical protein